MLVLQKLAKILEFEFLAVGDSCTADNLSMQDILLQNIYTYIIFHGNFLMSYWNMFFEANDFQWSKSHSQNYDQTPWITLQDDDRQAYLLCVEGSVQMVDAKGKVTWQRQLPQAHVRYTIWNASEWSLDTLKTSLSDMFGSKGLLQK